MNYNIAKRTSDVLLEGFRASPLNSTSGEKCCRLSTRVLNRAAPPTGSLSCSCTLYTSLKCTRVIPSAPLGASCAQTILLFEGFCIIFTLPGVPTVHPITATQGTILLYYHRRKGSSGPLPHTRSKASNIISLQHNLERALQQPTFSSSSSSSFSLGPPNLPGQTVTKQRQLTGELYTVSGGLYSKSRSTMFWCHAPSLSSQTHPPPKLCSFGEQ